MAIYPSLLGCLGLILTVRALVIGDASAGGDGIPRDDEPLFYWLCIVAAVIFTFFMFYIGLRS